MISDVQNSDTHAEAMHLCASNDVAQCFNTCFWMMCLHMYVQIEPAKTKYIILARIRTIFFHRYQSSGVLLPVLFSSCCTFVPLFGFVSINAITWFASIFLRSPFYTLPTDFLHFAHRFSTFFLLSWHSLQSFKSNLKLHRFFLTSSWFWLFHKLAIILSGASSKWGL